MPNRINDSINVQIMENELAATEWKYNELVWELRWWIDFFNLAFFRDEPVPIPVLTFEKGRVNTLGSYRIGMNDWAVRNQINLNKLYINRPLWETLATLLHELVHSWEYQYVEKRKRTKNWYHPKSFRFKMMEFGINTNDKGMHCGVGDPFKFLLEKHGVDFSMLEPAGKLWIGPKMTIKKGKSKLRKWTCGCTNVRVAIKDFQAECLKCGNRFKLED